MWLSLTKCNTFPLPTLEIFFTISDKMQSTAFNNVHVCVQTSHIIKPQTISNQSGCFCMHSGKISWLWTQLSLPKHTHPSSDFSLGGWMAVHMPITSGTDKNGTWKVLKMQTLHFYKKFILAWGKAKVFYFPFKNPIILHFLISCFL